MDVIDYTPAPTIKAFIKDYLPGELFYDWIVGPVGSGKTSGIFFKLVHMAGLQHPGPDGVRRSRAVIVRNTAPQLKDTTIASWNYWFKDGQAGEWRATERNFTLRFNGSDGKPVECEVLFRPLDTPDDIARVLSLEVTFVLIDEFVQIPREIVDALSVRVGRFPPAKDGGATNFGLWGSSNPDTEDNWWYDYLHNNAGVTLYKERKLWPRNSLFEEELGKSNIKYFLQPSGLSDGAENLENLRGGREYYTNAIIGKSSQWIKQFVDAEWGFSAAGKPVVSTFKPDLHISRNPLKYNPFLPIIGGLDPGITGSAIIFGQLSYEGRLNILGELVQQGFGSERLIQERVKPYLRNRFPNGKLIIAADPAANSRTQTDERTVVSVFKKHFGNENVRMETNNRLPLRLDAIEHYTTKLLEGGPALQIDAQHCPMLVRALKGGWRFAADPKKDMLKGLDPEKNQYSHPGDAFGYLCRFFYKQGVRESQYGDVGGKKFVPPRQFGAASYHMK